MDGTIRGEKNFWSFHAGAEAESAASAPEPGGYGGEKRNHR